MNPWIIDTETAGLKGGVMEFAALRIDENCNVLDTVYSRINPERPVEPGAFEIHGISDEDVKDCPTLSEFLGVQETPLDWIGHNQNFDERMCGGIIVANRKLCTLKAARQHIKDSPNHKLETLKVHLMFSEQKAHSALGDCHTTRELLLYLLNKTGASLETMFARNAAVSMVHTMPWGKHKGMQLVMLPKQYREWLLSADIDQDLRYSLKKIESI